MPLSESVNRKLFHTRHVTCKGYKRDDGLWDIEGHIVDTKPYSFPNKDRGGEIQAGEPLHEMWIRLTIDTDMNVIDAEGCIDASPFSYCSAVSPIIKKLIGLQIAPGWTKKTRMLMGGTKGCTHLTELLGPIATTAYQTMVSARGEYANARENKDAAQPTFINQCFSLAVESPVVLENWPQFAKKSEI